MRFAMGVLMFGSLLMGAGVEMPPFYADKSRLLVYLDEQGKEQPVKRLEDWSQRRAHILANMQLVMGPLPAASHRVPLDIQVEETAETDKYTRKKISFAVEAKDRVPAYLFIPAGKSFKPAMPAMLCLHQTTRIGKGEPADVGGLANLHYARELAERGYVTLAPDYPGYGDYAPAGDGSRSEWPYKLGYVSATMKGIWNHMRAVDLLQSLPEVDKQRIGCIGHSLGGHNTMFVAAFDERIKVMVSSCGFNALAKYNNGNIRGWGHRGYMPRIIDVYDADPKKMPFDFTEIVAALAPRPFFINAPLGDSNFEVSGVKDCVTAALPVYELFGAKDRLVAAHPDCAHDFPPQVRERAYAFIDKHLRPKDAKAK